MSNAVFGAPGTPTDAPPAAQPELRAVTELRAVVDRVEAAVTNRVETVVTDPVQTPRADAWATRFRARVVTTDLLLIAAAMVSTLLFPQPGLSLREHVALLVVAGAAWAVTLTVFDGKGTHALGSGTRPYRSVVTATLVFLGALVLVSSLLGLDVRPEQIALSVTAGAVALVVGRAGWRGWLRHERAAGRSLDRVVLVGSPHTIEHAMTQLERHPQAGYRVVGTVIPGRAPEDEDDDALTDEVTAALGDAFASTVMITSSDALTPARMRGLSWHLERHAARLVVTPSLTDVAASRIRTQPAAGLPLIHVQTPTYTGPQRVLKRAVDMIGSGAILLVLSPGLIITAVAVKLTSPGPVFYAQERIGRDNRPFGILKFRSMVPDADARLQALLAEQGTADTPLFKIQKDPRLTRIGGFLRRYSIDELPQLVNVLRGDMSLVGPRPQRPAEVALYDRSAFRRLNVRPGMTGLWQVSGRSRLTWQEAIRLDLDYVENWSLTVDFSILWRTARAVLGSDGAI